MTETDLRWQLRQLPREIEPARDLWPDIQARIQQPAARRPARPWLAGFAMAASLMLAAGLFWKGQPATPRVDDTAARIVAAETDAITHEYQAALQQLDGAPIPVEIRPSLVALDRSVGSIRRALDADPDSLFLLQQLRRTYSRRLELTQRAVTS